MVIKIIELNLLVEISPGWGRLMQPTFSSPSTVFCPTSLALPTAVSPTIFAWSVVLWETVRIDIIESKCKWLLISQFLFSKDARSFISHLCLHLTPLPSFVLLPEIWEMNESFFRNCGLVQKLHIKFYIIRGKDIGSTCEIYRPNFTFITIDSVFITAFFNECCIVYCITLLE